MHQRGFSLLELLVALFIVMIIASLVTLNVNSGGQDIELQGSVRSLANVSTYAMDEAQMNGRDMGLLIERADDRGESVYRYSWRERREQGWREPERDQDIFGTQGLPPGIELSLVLEDLPVAELGFSSGAVDLAPQVVFYASGETTPGYLELRRDSTGDVLWLIEWDLLGRFTLLPGGHALDDESDER